MNSMLVLHATWRDNNLLHVWTEIESGGKRAPQGTHPFAGDPKSVRETLNDLLPPSMTGALKELSDGVLSLSLPTRAGRPLPSDERLDDGTPDGAGQPPTMAPWTVPGVTATGGAAAEWLVGLPRKGEEPPGVAIGDDVRWFTAASRLALDLIVRERYVPSAEGRWEPVLSAPGVFERCRHLAVGMPDGCRAQPTDRNFQTRSAVLRAFLRAAVDGFVRTRHEPDASVPWALGRWLEALGPSNGRGTSSSTNPVPVQVPSDIAELVKAWSGPVMTLEPYEGARTCFSLEPPHHERHRGRGRGGPPPNPEWQLRFLLEPVGHPEKAMPAAILWRNQVPIPPERRPAAQDRFLADVVRANREFPPLTRALQEKLPRSVTLSVHEAYTFLTTVAPLLTESGTALQIPEELVNGRARIGVQVKLNPANGQEGFAAPVKVEYSLSAGDVPLTQQELQALIEARLPLVQIRGRWVELRPGDIKAAGEIINGKPVSKPLAEALFGAWGEGETDGLPVMGVTAEGWLQKLLGSDDARLEAVDVPKEFHGTLRPYQVRGLSWLDFLRTLGAGACLADDMGLGKTIQALALLLRHRKDQEEPRPSLLIAPTSVLGNWEREAKKFAPDLKIHLHDGPDRAKGAKFAKAVNGKDLVITSYALLNIDKELLTATPWDTVLVDEAQNIKNPHARQSAAARSLNSRYRIALTGTPVENRLSELWSIFEFLNPGYLGSLETFRTTLANPIERAHSKGHADRLRKLVQPFMLRRVKTDPGIAPELPQKIETTETCRLTKEQAELYQTTVKDMMKKIEDTDGIERKGHVLATLTKLKQVCNHPAQAKKDNSRLPGRSGKLTRLDELLEEIVEEGQSALVFTQYAEMAELLRRHLTKTLDDADVLLLTGSTPREEREELIADFQSEDGTPKIFILSLKAGGTGLNLTAASHVLHFDRWWNPAVEAQATDRAYRIGQDKTVHVHAFVTAGTIEERVAAMLESKKSLAGKIVGTGEDWITELSTANLKDLFMLRAESLAEDE